MSLTNEQYDTIMRIYSRRQADNRFRQKERQQAVYDAIPAFADLETEISSLQASRARLMLDDQAGQARCCADRLHTLYEQRNHLLAEHGFPADYLKPHYICPDCQDTGYIGRQKCHCFGRRRSTCCTTSPTCGRCWNGRIFPISGKTTIRKT